MFSVVRTALIWIAVIAIPAQGMAAGTMIHCGPGHASRMASLVAVDDHAGHGDRQATGLAHASHDAKASGTETAIAGSDEHDDADFAKATKRGGMFKCSACAASCCMALALLPVMVTVEVVATSVSVQPIPGALARAFVTNGPDRPPRIFLA